MEYLVTLTEQDMRIISAAVQELPYRVAAALMDKLKAQTADPANRKGLPVSEEPRGPILPTGERSSF